MVRNLRARAHGRRVTRITFPECREPMDDADTLKRVEGEGQVVFRYAEGTNPNGSINDIAGILNAEKNVLGLMPHPENLIEAAHGGTDGRALFSGLLQQVA